MRFPLSTEFYSTSLLFTHQHEDDLNSSDDSRVVKLLTMLVENSAEKVLPETSSLFTEVVFAMRSVNERSLGEIMRRLKTCFGNSKCQAKINNYWQVLFFFSNKHFLSVSNSKKDYF